MKSKIPGRPESLAELGQAGSGTGGQAKIGNLPPTADPPVEEKF